jgi:hypothetical protein
VNLNDDTPLADAVIFAELAEKFPDVVSFNVADLVEMPERWHWDWKPKARAMMEELIGRPDVTAWTQEDGGKLRAILNEPAGVHSNLLSLREDETVLIPAAVASPSAAGAGDADPVIR